MPTYEYKCRDCGESLEIVQSITDDPLTVCPACRGDLRKVFHPVGIAFKGSGFYKTDSRSSNGKAKGSSPESKGSESKASESKGEPAGASSSDSTGKGDTKKSPDAKASATK